MELVDVLVQELPKRGGWPDGADFAVQNCRDGSIKFGKKPIEIAISEKWNNELWQGEWHFSYQYDFICHEVSTDCREVIVLRGDYEAALAASKQWNGEAPPAIIGRFVPIGSCIFGRMPFNVLTRVASDYMPPAWEGIREGGEGYHVIESAWRFEPAEWNGEGEPPVGAEVECICNEFPNDGQEKLLGHILYSGEYTILKTYQTNNQHHVPVESVFKTKNWAIIPIRSEADKKREKGVVALATADPKVAPFKYGEKTSHGELIGSAWYDLYDAIAAGKIPGIRID